MPDIILTSLKTGKLKIRSIDVLTEETSAARHFGEYLAVVAGIWPRAFPVNRVMCFGFRLHPGIKSVARAVHGAVFTLNAVVRSFPMKAVLGVFLTAWLLASPGSASGSGDKSNAQAIKELAQTRLDAAERTYDLKWKRLKNGVAILDPEGLCLWSCRILEAAQEVSSEKADRLAALQAHLDRMVEVERVAKRFAKAGQGGEELATAAEFFRLEAELWLAKAKAK